MKAIAIDDEPVALDIINMMAAKVDFISLEGSYADAFKGLGHLREKPVDLIFMDINMPDISGIDLIKSLPQKPLIIFTTAYAEHAVESFNLDAVDYLLKPFAFPRFIRACTKAQELYQSRNSSDKKEYLFLKDGYEQVKVFFDDILYLQATGNYVSFVLTEGKVLTRMTINECLELLPTDRFMRVHRSFIVATSRITKVQRHQLHLHNVLVPIGSLYAKEIGKIN